MRAVEVAVAIRVTPRPGAAAPDAGVGAAPLPDPAAHPDPALDPAGPGRATITGGCSTQGATSAPALAAAVLLLLAALRRRRQPA